MSTLLYFTKCRACIRLRQVMGVPNYTCSGCDFKRISQVQENFELKAFARQMHPVYFQIKDLWSYLLTWFKRWRGFKLIIAK